MKKKIDVKIKGKGTVGGFSPWTCRGCKQPIETPEELAPNAARLPYHVECLKKAEKEGNLGVPGEIALDSSKISSPDAPE